MKVWADLSSIARLAAVCLLVGFVLGLFVACSSVARPTAPADGSDQSRQAAPVALAPEPTSPGVI